MPNQTEWCYRRHKNECITRKPGDVITLLSVLSQQSAFSTIGTMITIAVLVIRTQSSEQSYICSKLPSK